MAGCDDFADVDGSRMKALGTDQMTLIEKQFSGAKATVAGAVAGLLITCAAAMIFVAVAAGKSAYFASHGLTPSAMILLALPGTLAMGSIVAFPTSAAMVWCITAAAKRMNVFDSPAIWIASGALFSSPTAYFFSTMQPGRDQFSWISLWSFFLMVGGISGLTRGCSDTERSASHPISPNNRAAPDKKRGRLLAAPRLSRRKKVDQIAGMRADDPA